jgi:hypothetical protein
MFVRVEYAAESVSSADVELVESVGFGERLGGWPEGRAVQGPVVMIPMPSVSKTESNAGVYLLSRSLIRYLTVASASWRSVTRFLATWVVHSRWDGR